MLIPFHEMPPTSRIWIYQAAEPFSEDSKHLISDKLNDFLSQWESHGAPLKGSWKIFHDLFLVIGIDESYHAASGCSIDKSVNLVKTLELELGNELLGKNKVALLKEDKITLFDLKNLKKLIEEQKITHNSIIFNNLISNLSELEGNWKMPAGKTWLSRYFNK